jgi:Fe-S cluster assembly iron-binding protein IscA
MVEITDVAKDKLKELLDENPGKYLRIVMEGVG